MRTVYKYTLDHGVNRVSMPEGASILSAQMQHGKVCLWALHYTENKQEERRFCFFGTGRAMPDELGALKFIGTVQDAGGMLVWHVFEME